MNNRKSDDMSGAGAAIGYAGLVAVCLLLLVYALAAFACLLLTFVCWAAWNKPVTIGEWTIQPDEARGFVGCGAVCAIALVGFVAFADGFLGLMLEGRLYLPRQWPLHCAIFGYIAGSMGFAWSCAKQYKAQARIETPRPLPSPPSENVPEKPFAFASWDDEETRG